MRSACERAGALGRAAPQARRADTPRRRAGAVLHPRRHARSHAARDARHQLDGDRRAARHRPRDGSVGQRLPGHAHGAARPDALPHHAERHGCHRRRGGMDGRAARAGARRPRRHCGRQLHRRTLDLSGRTRARPRQSGVHRVARRPRRSPPCDALPRDGRGAQGRRHGVRRPARLRRRGDPLRPRGSGGCSDRTGAGAPGRHRDVPARIAAHGEQPGGRGQDIRPSERDGRNAAGAVAHLHALGE